MTIRDVLLPLFVEVILTFVLLFWMAFLRTTAIAGGSINTRDIALREPKWPTKAMQVANCFSNQFEIPVLFYVVTILALSTRQADLLFVCLSWLFVVLRYVHAFIHTTSNRVARRGFVYGLGVLVVMALWVELALRLYLL